MKLSANSRNRLMETFKLWDVPKDFADPMYNYLVHGYNPGSCFTSALANDFAGAIDRSHPNNTVEAFKALTGWISDTVPLQASGSYSAVSNWSYLKPEQRREILEGLSLVFSVEDEAIMILSGTVINEPVLY
jgi:hypothetical protein